MDSRIVLDDGWVDPERREVHRGDTVAKLRGKEAELLAFLAARPGRTVLRGELFEQVFGYHPDTRSRTLDTTVRRIRAAIEEDPRTPRHLLTEVGMGYRFVPPTARGDAAEAFLAEGVARLAAELGDQGLRVLSGPPGIGRSTWARRLAETRSGTLVTGPLDAVARGLGLDPGDGEERLAARIGTWLAAHPGLLVVDDAGDDVLAAAPAWVRAQGVRVVLSRRVRPRGPELVAHPVPPLPDAAARALFLRRWRALGHDAAEVALENLAGLPLAIELAAALADVVGIDGLARRLSHGPGAVLEAPGGDALEAALLAAIDALSEGARAALGTLALLGGPVDTELAAQVAGGLGHVATLLDQGLLLRDARGWVIVPLATRVARACPGGDLDRVRRALADRCEALVDPLLGPRTDDDAEALDALGPVLSASGPAAPLSVRRALAHLLVERHQHTAAAALVADDLVLHARLHDAPPDVRLSLLDSAPPGPATEAVRVQLLRHAGRAAEAIRRTPSDDEHGLAVGDWAVQLAMTFRHVVDIDQVLHWARRALRELSEHPRLRQRANSSLAEAYVLTGQLDQAVAVFEAMLESTVSDRIDAGIGLAVVALNRRDADGARARVRQVVEQIPRARDILAMGACHHAALVFREVGDLDEARALLVRGLQLASLHPQLPYLEARMAAMLATVQLDAGQPAEALAMLEAAPDGHPLGLMYRAAALELCGDARAGAAWDEALSLEMDDRRRHLVRSLAPGADRDTWAAALAFAHSSLDAAIEDAATLLLAREPSAPPALFWEARLASRLMSHRRRVG